MMNIFCQKQGKFHKSFVLISHYVYLGVFLSVEVPQVYKWATEALWH